LQHSLSFTDAILLLSLIQNSQTALFAYRYFHLSISTTIKRGIVNGSMMMPAAHHAHAEYAKAQYRYHKNRFESSVRYHGGENVVEPDDCQHRQHHLSHDFHQKIGGSVM
jgi:hypothetical protein